MYLFNKTASKNFICAISFLACFFTACSDANPFDKTEDDIADTRYKIERDYNSKENNSTTNSSKSQSDSYSQSNYNSGANSTLNSNFSILIDLTKFKQLSANWEEEQSNKNNYSDGDPSISFVIRTYTNNILKDSVRTNAIRLNDNIGSWSGHENLSKKLNGGIDQISICPIVYERNLILSDVWKSSGKCYDINNVGKKVNTIIPQSDTWAKNYELKWDITIKY